MLDLWTAACLTVFDTLLGWLLYLPSDLSLVSLALLTAGLMVLVRPLVTNQDKLGRVDDDRRRLAVLMRQARKARDKQALARYRSTGTMLSMRKLAAEGWPLLVAIVPVGMLATWAMYRLEFHPPAENETIEVIAQATSPTAAGEVIHLVPSKDEGLKSANGWVRMLTLEPNEPGLWDRFLVWTKWAEPTEPEKDAVARWKLKGKAKAEPYELIFRFREPTIKPRKLWIGQTIYSPQLVAEDGEPIVTQIKMRPVELFHIVPGLGDYLPGWMVGYIIIAVPLVFFLKWLLKIY